MTSLSKFIHIALSAFLLTVCLASSAKADTIENLLFTGAATCINAFCSGIGSGAVTGTYTLDVTTGTIGAWSFSTPFGVMNSADIGASYGVFVGGGPSGNDIGSGFQVYVPSPLSYTLVLLYFPAGDIQELGALDPAQLSFGCSATPGVQNVGGSCNPDYTITGATTLATPVATPEPGTGVLSMVGIGLLGLSMVRRRCMARGQPLAA